MEFSQNHVRKKNSQSSSKPALGGGGKTRGEKKGDLHVSPRQHFQGLVNARSVFCSVTRTGRITGKTNGEEKGMKRPRPARPSIVVENYITYPEAEI